MRGRFITLEGGEGAGKSTQASRLAAWVREQGHRVVETREPGGSPGGEILRDVLVNAEADRWDAVGEALILSAARRDHLRQVIWPALRDGQWVICDRFADSTRAYQGYGHGLSAEALDILYELVAGPFGPDLTLILDMDPREGLRRARSRGPLTRFETLDIEFHSRVRLGFQEIAGREPERCSIIEADSDADTVTARILGCVRERIETWCADDDMIGGGVT